VLAALLLLGLALRVSFFAISVHRIPPMADEAITALQAKQILQGHCPLLFTAQPYMFPLESYLNVPHRPLPAA